MQCTGLGNQLCPIEKQTCEVNTAPEECTTDNQPFSVYLGATQGQYLLIEYDLVNGSYKSLLDYEDTSGITGSVPVTDYDAVCHNDDPGRLLDTLTWNIPGNTVTPHSSLSIKHIQGPSCANGLKGIAYLSYESDVGELGAEIQFEAYVRTCKEQPPYICPTDEDAACVENGAGNYECSVNPCVDLDETPPIDNDISTAWLQDDGRYDEDTNVCMDSMHIFSGRPMRCDKKGKATGYQECCKPNDSGEVYAESTGGSAEATATTGVLAGSYSGAVAAYGAYTTAISQGASTTAAASSAGNAFVVGFDPATLAIAVAVAVAVEYFTQSCDLISMETNMMNGSGLCSYVGDYCREEWPLVGCVQRSQSYCCYNSKMSKLINEQGRAQLTTLAPLGVPGNPVCTGFTPEQFQAIDFSQIDFSGYYHELVADEEVNLEDAFTQGTEDYLSTVD